MKTIISEIVVRMGHTPFEETEISRRLNNKKKEKNKACREFFDSMSYTDQQLLKDLFELNREYRFLEQRIKNRISNKFFDIRLIIMSQQLARLQRRLETQKKKCDENPSINYLISMSKGVVA